MIICIQIIQEYSRKWLSEASLLRTVFQCRSPSDWLPGENTARFSRAAANAVPSSRSENTSQVGVQHSVL